MRIAAPLRLALLSAFLAMPVAFAQDVDAGPPAAVVAPVAAPTTPTAAPAPEAAPAPTSLDNPVSFVKVIFTNVKDGNWWGAAAALLVLIVSLIRVYGKKLHDKLPDNVVWDKPLWFLFDTKPGGWLLNVATAVAGGTGTAMLAGEPVTWALVKPILTVAVTGAALWEMVKDLFEWIKAKGAPKQPDPVPAPPPPKP